MVNCLTQLTMQEYFFFFFGNLCKLPYIIISENMGHMTKIRSAENSSHLRASTWGYDSGPKTRPGIHNARSDPHLVTRD